MSVSPTQKSTTTQTGCDCINLTDKALAEMNTQLDWQCAVNRKTGKTITTVMIGSSVIEKKRGAKAARVIPTFCPFCGNRYQPEVLP